MYIYIYKCIDVYTCCYIPNKYPETVPYVIPYRSKRFLKSSPTYFQKGLGSEISAGNQTWEWTLHTFTYRCAIILGLPIHVIASSSINQTIHPSMHPSKLYA